MIARAPDGTAKARSERTERALKLKTVKPEELTTTDDIAAGGSTAPTTTANGLATEGVSVNGRSHRQKPLGNPSKSGTPPKRKP